MALAAIMILILVVISNPVAGLNVTSDSGIVLATEKLSKANEHGSPAPLTFECPADISTYTDINECTAEIISNMELKITSGELTELYWVMTGATTDASPRKGIYQLYSFIFNEGTTTVTYYARDNKGNTQTCTFNVIVSDNQVPRFITVPENITVNADPAECGAHVTWEEPVVDDNCSSPA